MTSLPAPSSAASGSAPLPSADDKEDEIVAASPLFDKESFKAMDAYASHRDAFKKRLVDPVFMARLMKEAETMPECTTEEEASAIAAVTKRFAAKTVVLDATSPSQSKLLYSDVASKPASSHSDVASLVALLVAGAAWIAVCVSVDWF